MARYVKLTVVYDMDDTEKALGAELQDWVDGNVSLGDLSPGEYELVGVTDEESLALQAGFVRSPR